MIHKTAIESTEKYDSKASQFLAMSNRISLKIPRKRTQPLRKIERTNMLISGKDSSRAIGDLS